MKGSFFILICFLLLVLSSACTKRQRYGDYALLYNDSEGTAIYNVRCKKDIADCYKGAGKACAQGFDIIDWQHYKAYGPVSVPSNRKDDSVTEKVIKGNGTFMTGGGTMLFKCKK